jgi:hypothetical protein
VTQAAAQAGERTSLRAGRRLPVYCPLELDFDAERLHAELIALAPRFESLATKGSNLDPARWFPLGEPELYRNLEHYVEDPARPDGPPVFVAGSVPGWWGLSLTHVPGLPETGCGSNRYRRRHDGRWTWKSGLDLPCTRALLERLPFTRLDTVRVMTLPAGGFGPAHADCRDDTPWEIDGIASISFLVRDGGVPMRFQAPDGALRDVRDPVFFFKDCAPHGVPRTSSRRVLLRVNGAAEPQALLGRMRLRDAIW